MKKVFGIMVTLLKWVIISAAVLEVFSFLIVMTSNYWIYGQLRDGDRVRYDPYILFQTVGYPRPTANNPGSGDRGKCKTLWLFGGSTMSGCTDDDTKTIPSFLAEILNQQPPVLPAYLINYGEPSFNSLMETKYLQKVLSEGLAAPEVVIFYDGANDCAYFAQDRTPSGGHLGYSRLKGFIECYHRSLFGLLKPVNAALYSSFTRELYDKIRQGVIPIEEESPALRRFVDTAEKRYDYVNKIAGLLGVKFFLFWQPQWWVETGQVSPEGRKAENIILGNHLALRHNFQVINQALVARLKDKPYFIDFQNILCPRREPVYQSDGIHLQDMGRKMVAQGMGRILKEQLLTTAALGGNLP